MSKTKLNVTEIEIVLYKQNEEEFISLTDMAKFRDSERANSIGIISGYGRYGGTYAHKDIAFEFASWVKQHKKSTYKSAVSA